ncbi:MAG: NAD-dependent epimerase/dehydratase family protein [Acidobacteria bacterium]|nr:NAD-dependent epimerase/dehydratase family protein [Acidobacteriota bacterium]
MRKPVVLITGANGEIGHSLIEYLGQFGKNNIVGIDLNPVEKSLTKYCTAAIVGDILDGNLLQRLVSEYEVHEIYHLAALLSTRSEYTPARAHRVNVDGTLNLLQLSHEQSRWHGHTVKFLFPSSVAAYGMPDRAVKNKIHRVRETEFNFPTTMYGCNKLYCEHLGRYFTLHFRQLAAERAPSGVDFRALRFPGLISAVTIPSGGTSDYAPEMIHAAAKGESYACFVDEETRLPFMVMPDAIKALTMIANAPAERLTQHVYNVTSFSLTAGEFRDLVLKAFPEAQITFKPDEPRAHIVDSWPSDIDDTPARRDWGWKPDYDIDRAFDEYLVPTISRYYQKNSETL